jgi:hypothetical protein
VVKRTQSLIQRIGEKVGETIERNEQIQEWIHTFERIDLDDRPGFDRRSL